MNTEEIIRKAGLKATPQRKMVYTIMAELCHSPIDIIITRVQQQNPEITVSTVYRILDSFCEAGLLLKIKHPNGKFYFDINPMEHHHVFTDNEVIDFIDPELTEMIKERLQVDSFKHLEIEKISIQIIAKQKTSNK